MCGPSYRSTTFPRPSLHRLRVCRREGLIRLLGWKMNQNHSPYGKQVKAYDSCNPWSSQEIIDPPPTPSLYHNSPTHVSRDIETVVWVVQVPTKRLPTRGRHDHRQPRGEAGTYLKGSTITEQLQGRVPASFKRKMLLLSVDRSVWYLFEHSPLAKWPRVVLRGTVLTCYLVGVRLLFL